MKKLDAENRTHAAFLASKIFQTAGERTSKAGQEQ
jgi:hypothetical protein